MHPTRQRRRGPDQGRLDAVDGQTEPATLPSDGQALRAKLHTALDALLDGLDEYRRAPLAEELVRVRDLPFEVRARTELVASGQLRTVQIGRELWTRRSWVAAAVDALPVHADEPEGQAREPDEPDEGDDVLRAARERALRTRGAA